MNPPPATAEAAARAPRSRFRYLLYASVILGTATLVSCVGGVVWFFTPTKIVIAKETTYVTEPLDSEGYVDYLEALNQRASEGVTPENNAVVPILRAWGPSNIDKAAQPEFYRRLGVTPEAGEPPFVDFDAVTAPRRNDEPMTNYDAAVSRPWSAEEFPRVAQWLERNTRALELIEDASRRPRYYAPFVTEEVPRTLNAPLPVLQITRKFMRLLKLRAMHRLYEGRVEEAREDLLAVHRLSRLVAQSPLVIDWLVAVGCEQFACSGDIEFAKVATRHPDEARRLLDELGRLAPLPLLWERVNTSERCVQLDTLTSISRYGPEIVASDVGKTGPRLAPMRSIDWNFVLRRSNDWIDKLVDALDEPTWKARTTKLQVFNQELRQHRTITIGWPTRRYFSQALCDLMAGLSLSHFAVSLNAEESVRMRQEIARIALALSIWRSEHGAYPETLAVLSPELVETVPSDRFTEGPLDYEVRGDGYIIRCLGPNGSPDSPNEFDRDDLVVEVP